MAIPQQGYQCEFIDQVVDDFYCKKCTLVARRLTITTCCAESFCQSCIAGVTDQCPVCGEKEFSAFQHAKNQKRICCLRIYCTMKDRGCSWSGPLEQLDSHLDTDLNNCQYVDTKCPLSCKQAIPKNKMEQHVASECVKRNYFCQYCSFKATYEEVVDKHLPGCKYVPLQCPNMCGVTFERDFMEDHMKICRLEEVDCEFSGVGCEEKIRREDQEEHTRQNSHKHLSLTAVLAMGTKEELQLKILEQDKKIQALEKKLEEKEKKLQYQVDQHEEEEQKMKGNLEEQKKLQEELNEGLKNTLELKLEEQKKMLEQTFDLKLSKLQELLYEFKTKSEENEKKLDSISLHGRQFELKNFSKEKEKTYRWLSPPMYTHVCGYKFCIAVYPRGLSGTTANISLGLLVMPGEYDSFLKWPAKIKLTVQLINQQGGKHVSSTCEATLKQVKKLTYICGIATCLTERYELGNYIVNDTLYFYVSNIELL